MHWKWFCQIFCKLLQFVYYFVLHIMIISPNDIFLYYIYFYISILHIRPPSPLVHNLTHLLWPLFLHTYFVYIHPLPRLVNFYSDSSFCHSQFLGFFHFYFSLRLNFAKPISKNIYGFYLKLKAGLHFFIHKDKWQCNSFFCTKKEKF